MQQPFEKKREKNLIGWEAEDFDKYIPKQGLSLHKLTEKMG